MEHSKSVRFAENFFFRAAMVMIVGIGVAGITSLMMLNDGGQPEAVPGAPGQPANEITAEVPKPESPPWTREEGCATLGNRMAYTACIASLVYSGEMNPDEGARLLQDHVAEMERVGERLRTEWENQNKRE